MLSDSELLFSSAFQPPVILWTYADIVSYKDAPRPPRADGIHKTFTAVKAEIKLKLAIFH